MGICVTVSDFLRPYGAHQAPLSMGCSRQEYWSGLPCSLLGYLPDPGIESASLLPPTLGVRFFTTNTTWEAQVAYFVWNHMEWYRRSIMANLFNHIIGCPSEYSFTIKKFTGTEMNSIFLKLSGVETIDPVDTNCSQWQYLWIQDWDDNTAKGRWNQSHFAGFFLQRLKWAHAKILSYAKLTDRTQREGNPW